MAAHHHLGSTAAGFAAAVALLLASSSQGWAGPIFEATLSGAEEVPPVATDASGTADFVLNDAATELAFGLDVFDIDDVIAAHIHLGPAGVNGPIVAFLFSGGPTGLVNGTLSSGTVTAADLINDLAGQPLSALVDAMEAENTYVNVHTTPFPAGEIRGQIFAAAAPIPEPPGMALIGAGLLGLWLSVRQRVRRANARR